MLTLSLASLLPLQVAGEHFLLLLSRHFGVQRPDAVADNDEGFRTVAGGYIENLELQCASHDSLERALDSLSSRPDHFVHVTRDVVATLKRSQCHHVSPRKVIWCS